MMDKDDRIKETIERLKQRIKPPEPGWSESGDSPLTESLKLLVEGLDQVKAEMQKQHARKLKSLETLLRHNVSSDPRYRVRK
jgi:molybdenum-dependent DNA-binding transcriptional regulator ModE